MIGNGIARMIEEWWAELVSKRGIPGGAIRDQLRAGALPPAGNTGRGYTPDPDAVTRVSVRKNSTGSTYSRRRLNLIEGSGATITIADDGTSEEVDITIAASGGGGGSLTVEEVDGSPTDSAVTKLVFPNGTLAIASHVATYTPAAGGAGALTALGTATLSGVGQLTVSGIASGYKALLIVARLRADGGTNDDAVLFCNADTTFSNYKFVYIGGASASGNAPAIGPMPGSASGEWAAISFVLPAYDQAIAKQVAAQYLRYTGGSIVVGQAGWVWPNTAAVTSITLGAYSASGNNLDTGSTVTVYGVG